MELFKFTRAPDWPKSMHASANRYENAVRAVATAGTEKALNSAIDALDAARADFGRELLALDKLRRPEMYQS